MGVQSCRISVQNWKGRGIFFGYLTRKSLTTKDTKYAKEKTAIAGRNAKVLCKGIPPHAIGFIPIPPSDTLNHTLLEKGDCFFDAAMLQYPWKNDLHILTRKEVNQLQKHALDRAQGLVEYALILVLVVLVVFVTLLLFGPMLGNIFSGINSTLSAT